jgi:hypothetical protein
LTFTGTTSRHEAIMWLARKLGILVELARIVDTRDFETLRT